MNAEIPVGVVFEDERRIEVIFNDAATRSVSGVQT
jgi:hypothetical protein